MGKVKKYCVFCNRDEARKEGGGFICDDHAAILKDVGFGAIHKVTRTLTRVKGKSSGLLDKLALKMEKAAAKEAERATKEAEKENRKND